MANISRNRPLRRREYRTKLKVQTLSTGSTGADSRGHSQRTFATVTTLWANVEALGGDEPILAREIVDQATHQVEHDYDSRVTTRARYVVAASTGRVMNILAVSDLGERGRTQRTIVKEEV